MDKVAIYCRLSDEDKDKNSIYDESESIQNQKKLLTKYAIDKGWTIYKIYSDDDYSGLDNKRPDFSLMIYDAENKKFNIILCKHQSRFSRDIEITEKYLHRKFHEWGIRFVSVTDNVDTFDKSNKKSRQINGLVNEWYSEDISEAIRATFKVKREEGKFIGSFAPYGYKKDADDKNKLVIDEEAAKIVKIIFEWYLEGNGTQHIANMLNERGMVNPTRYKQSNGFKYKNCSQADAYGLWNKTTIRRILRNEVYIGNVVQGKREKINYKSKRIVAKPKSKWVTVESKHEPIIDNETFYAVQKRLNNRVKSSGKGKIHIFAGKVRCMDCKSSMNKVKISNGYEYLRCKLYAKDPTKHLCSSHSIRLDRINEIVTNQIKKHIENVNSNNLVNRLKHDDLISNKLHRFKKQIKEIECKIIEIENIFKNLYIDKVNNLIDKEQFYALNNKFIKDKSELIRRKQIIKSEMNDMKNKIENMDKWMAVVKEYNCFTELTHTMVNTLIDFIEIGEKNKESKEQIVKIYWNF